MFFVSFGIVSFVCCGMGREILGILVCLGWWGGVDRWLWKKRGKEGESGGDRESLKKIKLQPNYQLEEAFIIILQHLQPFIQSVTVLEHMLDLLHCHLSYE